MRAYPVSENHAKLTPRRLVIIGGLIIAIVIGFFVLLPCTLRDLNSRALLGRDISYWNQVYLAVRIYHQERGHYPPSLTESDFQPYLGGHVAAFLREGRVVYHPPAADSPPTFILLQMTTPQGDYSIQLDGTRLYPNS